VNDALDGCPNDPHKTAAGLCGCGVADTDSDGDGTPDCHDGCPNDSGKTSPGVCGCGVADTDSDGDGVPDCNDACPNDPSGTPDDDCPIAAAVPRGGCGGGMCGAGATSLAPLMLLIISARRRAWGPRS